jgi:hypothetical protein
MPAFLQPFIDVEGAATQPFPEREKAVNRRGAGGRDVAGFAQVRLQVVGLDPPLFGADLRRWQHAAADPAPNRLRMDFETRSNFCNC